MHLENKRNIFNTVKRIFFTAECILSSIVVYIVHETKEVFILVTTEKQAYNVHLIIYICEERPTKLSSSENFVTSNFIQHTRI